MPPARKTGTKKSEAAKPAAKKPAAATKPSGRPKKPAASTSQPTKQQVKEQVRKYRKRADKYKNNPEKAEALLREAEEKARKNPGPMSARLQDLATLIRLARAYFGGAYRDVPWDTIALVVAAIAYFVSPIDLIPDFIPVAGYLDDATVIGFVLASVNNDLHNFREWEARKQLGVEA